MLPALRIELDPEFRSSVRLGVVEASPVRVGPPTEALDREMEAQASALRDTHAGRAPGEIAELAPARKLYRTFGVDPTRTRPSSEALLRRALTGKPLPRILDAVDLSNLLALRFLVPIGLYDADAIRGTARLRRGDASAEYEGVRKDRVRLGGRPALFDELGPFGNPTADSARTAVHATTRRLALVIFTPADLARSTLAGHLRTAADAVRRHLGEARTEVAIEIAGAP
jgi:DNA/RNA-binding domain of Phe-tRNA-synthetase-like protein